MAVWCSRVHIQDWMLCQPIGRPAHMTKHLGLLACLAAIVWGRSWAPGFWGKEEEADDKSQRGLISCNCRFYCKGLGDIINWRQKRWGTCEYLSRQTGLWGFESPRRGLEASSIRVTWRNVKCTVLGRIWPADSGHRQSNKLPRWNSLKLKNVSTKVLFSLFSSLLAISFSLTPSLKMKLTPWIAMEENSQEAMDSDFL